METGRRRRVLEQIKTEAADALRLPKDVACGEVLISFIGRRAVTVENYRGILHYDDNIVRLAAKHCKLEIRGRQLHIEYYNHEAMKITGAITGMEFGE
ncbi:MAG: YabP/YqfC family sporulation protein [Clostridiales bacterium]|nr:YabP/YqfC family sporulation protein [Clostridiales bacterium]